ncbi:MAG: 4-hydroxy-3-methylbut-2-enyl diphosphate reductase [candidate division Zixibacteria bacterium]|nr:4-hydroxy-3-methylbut-2-enyl diphosphate reductase [candidate division Zixibacteria bacterium]
MKISVVKNAGFCFGVKRAINLAFEAAKKSRTRVYTLGPLIHNPQVVEELKREGVLPIQNLNEIRKGTLIIRSHGIHPKVINEAKKKKLKIIDATCPFVRRAQEKARALYKDGYQVVVVGEAHHPEVQGIIGYTDGKAVVINQHSRNIAFTKNKRIGLIAQTTLNFDTFKKVVGRVLEKTWEIKIFNTICNATANAQKATLKMAKDVEVMVVVGGRNSANTTQLTKLCKEKGKPTYHIETESELKKKMFKSKKRIGVTAGTSTPEWIIKKVIEKISELTRK